MNLIQFIDNDGRRGVGIIEGPIVVPVVGAASVIALARLAIARGHDLEAVVRGADKGQPLDYKNLCSRGRILAPVDHPDIAHCLVTGTGLTHLGSADARDRMHKQVGGDLSTLSDSMKMFRLGLEGGKPDNGRPGVQPEWFYKGDGGIIVSPGADLPMPDFALDGGEEPEIVGIYLNDLDGLPWRIGFALGNEFSDHVMERQNYLNLAHSKLRYCSIGPELRTGPLPTMLSGESCIRRDNEVIWSRPFLSGEANMSHTITNLEFHHFKYDLFRRKDALHMHFFGTATLSFSDGIVLRDGDQMEVEVPEFGAPLSNTLRTSPTSFNYNSVRAL